MSEDIETIVKGKLLSTQFQPIIDVRSRTLLAYEALTRGPSDGPLHAPLALFAAATAVGVLPELELACLNVALERVGKARYAGRVFLNVSPHSLLASQDWPLALASLCEQHGVDPGACVLELTEQTLIEDFDAIRETLAALRRVGFDVAIDDFGTGHSGLRLWSELRPDFVKIDRYFANGIDRDPIKLEFVRSIIDMGRAVGSRVIVEGIETTEECRELIELDVDGAQGYLFGRPQAALQLSEAALSPLSALCSAEPPATAGQLLVEVAPVPPTMRVSEFIRIVHERSHISAFPVVTTQGEPVGMIWRDRFLINYSKPLQPEVLAKKPVSAVMDPAPLLVDSRLRLEQTSRLVTRKSRLQSTDQFIIVRDGVYAGLGQTIDLLSHITEARVQAATHSNPLTTLPGNVPIHDNILRVIQQGRPFIACYVDLDHFKPFNDYYGYAKGDQALLQLAQVLISVIARRVDFVGHIGGDDFMMILRSPDWQARLVRLVEEFSVRVRSLYSEEDLARGGIEAQDRDGSTHHFGLLTLSVAALDSRTRAFRDSASVSEALQAAKRRAKTIQGSCIWYEGPEGSRNLLGDPEALSVLSTEHAVVDEGEDEELNSFSPIESPAA